MADEGYMLSMEAVKRTSAVVRRVERYPPGPIDDGTASPLLPQQLILEARVTGEAINDSGDDLGDCDYLVYPAKLLQWNPSDRCWDDGMDIFLFGLNGESLSETRYTIKIIDSSFEIADHSGSGTKPLGYPISAGVGGDTTPTTFAATTCLRCVDGIPGGDTYFVQIPQWAIDAGFVVTGTPPTDWDVNGCYTPP